MRPADWRRIKPHWTRCKQEEAPTAIGPVPTGITSAAAKAAFEPLGVEVQTLAVVLNSQRSEAGVPEFTSFDGPDRGRQHGDREVRLGR